MPICKTKAADGRIGIGVNCEIADSELQGMSAGEVFERLAAEFWADFLRMAEVDPGEDLDRTYNRSFLDKATRIINQEREPLKCPVHDEEMEYCGYGSTLIAYFSPEGHDHDDNCKIHSWKCPIGPHPVKERKQNTCPVCDWKGKKECSICGLMGIRVEHA